MSRRFKAYILAIAAAYTPAAAFCQKVAPDLQALKNWTVTNRSAEPITEAQGKGIHLNEMPGDGLMILKDADFADGTIELDIKGSNKFQQSFVGVAFHVQNPATFDAVYFRPFNFKSDDPVRRTHTVQYISMPDNDWEKLRNQFPGKYEQPVNPVPDADEWFHVRILIKGRHVAVYVNNAQKPSLEVERLNATTHGGLGLWVGNNSAGSFANLTFTPDKGKLAYGNNPEPGRWPECLDMLSKLYNDGFLSTETFSRGKNAIPNAQLAVIAGCNHVVFFCNFPAVWDTVEPFLSN